MTAEGPTIMWQIPQFMSSQNSFFLRQSLAIGRKESFKTIRSNATVYDFLDFKIKDKSLPSTC